MRAEICFCMPTYHQSTLARRELKRDITGLDAVLSPVNTIEPRPNTDWQGPVHWRGTHYRGYYGGSNQDSDWGMMKTGGSGGDRRGLGCSVRGAKVRPGVSHCPPPKAWAGSAVSAWLPCYLANLMQNTFQLLISMYAFTDLSTHLQKTIANLNRFWVSFFTQLQIWLCTSGLR